ncbi:MAG: hypothetical protein WD156_12570 [Acidimicrobiia bacterium]
MRRVTAAAGVLFGFVLVACATASADPVTADHVALDEFSIATTGESWRAGSINLSVDNVGERDHTLVVSRESGEVVAATEIVAPGDVLEFEVALGAGTYQLTCRIVVEGGNGAIFDHFEQGMHTTIEVVEP